MTRIILALIGTILAFAVCRAEECAAPNVARVVIDPPGPHVTLEYRPPVLSCPTTGPCQMIPAIAPVAAPTLRVVCLSPSEEAEAEARAP